MQVEENGSVVWMDAKGFIDTVCSEMQPGEMMHGPHFSMMEAMAAIEIGDPKMDQGARLATSPDASLTFAQLLDTHAPISLSAAGVLAACDAMLAAEVTWHQGATMPQSLFSALYLHDLARYGSVKQLLVEDTVSAAGSRPRSLPCMPTAWPPSPPLRSCPPSIKSARPPRSDFALCVCICLPLAHVSSFFPHCLVPLSPPPTF